MIEGIVIDALDYQEKSKIVHLYTSFGMDSVLARDASKMTSGKLGFITTLNIVSYNKTEGGLGRLIDYSLIQSYYGEIDDLVLMKSLPIFFKVLKSLDSTVPHAKIYPFFKRCLAYLAEGKDVKMVLNFFLIKMLSVLGVRPVLNHCMYCNSLNLAGFSIRNGGVFCFSCKKPSNEETLLSEAFKSYYESKNLEDIVCQMSSETLLAYVYQYYQEHTQLKLAKIL